MDYKRGGLLHQDISFGIMPKCGVPVNHKKVRHIMSPRVVYRKYNKTLLELTGKG